MELIIGQNNLCSSMATSIETCNQCTQCSLKRWETHSRILGLPAFNSLLQYVNRLVWEICSVNGMLQNKEAWFQESKLAKMLCTGHREFGANRWRFLSKASTSYFRLCKNCEFMMCILIVNLQFNRMHPWCSWECMLPGRCSPGKRCHTFWNRNIVLLPILLGKVSCVPKTTR